MVENKDNNNSLDLIEKNMEEIDFIINNFLNKLSNYLLYDVYVEIPMNEYIKCISIFNKHCKPKYNRHDCLGNNDFPILDICEGYNFKIVYKFLNESIKTILESSDNDLYITNFSKFIKKLKQIMKYLQPFKSYTFNGDEYRDYKLFESLQYVKSILFNDINKENICFNAINSEIEKERTGVFFNNENINLIICFLHCLGYDNPILDFDLKTKEIDIVPLVRIDVYKSNVKILDIKKDKEIYKVGDRSLFMKWYYSQIIRIEEFIKKNLTNEDFNVQEYISFFNKFYDNGLVIMKYNLPIDVIKHCKTFIFEKFLVKLVVFLKNDPSGFENMFSDLKFKELSEVYRLFLNYEYSLDIILEELQKYIKVMGIKINSNDLFKNKPIILINKTIELYINISKMIKDSFNDNSKFIEAYNKTFYVFMKDSEIYPKFLAIYCDYYMTTRVKLTFNNSDEFVKDFNNIISLLKYLNDKHVFKMEYDKLLSYRLLNNKTYNLDAEKHLINEMSFNQGNTFVYEFTNKIKNLESSAQFNENFKNESHRGIILGIDLNCKMIEQNCWNINFANNFEIDICKYSPKINVCMKILREFYLKKNKSKKLQYVLGLVSNFLYRGLLKLKRLIYRRNILL